MKPTIGRIVHFYDRMRREPYGPGPFAAIVIAADDTHATLWVLFPAPGSPREIINVVAHDHPDAFNGPHWVWPPREG